mgnify:CR=1 FL=1
MSYVPKSELLAEINKLKNSKAVFLSRLEASPKSFGILGAVSDVVRDGVVTRFNVGGDVARVTIDAIGDKVTLAPIKRASQFKAVVIDLANEAPQVDFTPETAEQVYATYKLFDEGPAPTGAQLAAGLNSHVK